MRPSLNFPCHWDGMAMHVRSHSSTTGRSVMFLLRVTRVTRSHPSFKLYDMPALGIFHAHRLAVHVEIARAATVIRIALVALRGAKQGGEMVTLPHRERLLAFRLVVGVAIAIRAIEPRRMRIGFRELSQ